MKFWLLVITGWVMTFCLLWQGANLYLRRQLIKNHGKDLGLSYWKQWKL